MGSPMGRVVFGFFVTTSALSYDSVYTTPAGRSALAAAFETNLSTGALFCPGHPLNTVARDKPYSTSGSLWPPNGGSLGVVDQLLRQDRQVSRFRTALEIMAWRIVGEGGWDCSMINVTNANRKMGSIALAKIGYGSQLRATFAA